MNGEGVLILGEPGTGKSGLALRLIDEPGFGTSESPMRGRLISDDQVIITREENRLVASAPSSIRGKLEVRGLGIIDVPHNLTSQLALIVDLTAVGSYERLPDRKTTHVLGVEIPSLKIAPFEASAPVKLLLALRGCRVL